VLVFVIYQLGWSHLYPTLSYSLYIFFAVTFIIALILGYIFQKNKYIGFQTLRDNLDLRALLFIVVIWVGHCIEFLYFKEIPLFSLLFGKDVIDYREFGIKSFHVFLISFNSFTIVYLFHYYISTKKRKILYYFILALIPSILIINRGMFLIGAISSLFVYLLSLTKFLKIKQLMGLSLGVIIILFCFGYIGNLRSGHGDPNYIPSESKATKQFMKSSIPKEYYWTYLYGASPIANFQNNINKTSDVDYNFFSLILYETFPDVVSKRIGALFNVEKLGHKQIVPWLTVGSVYSKSYSYGKWFGPIIVFFYMIWVIILSIGLVPKNSSYHVTVIAILLTLVFMNTFDNMLVFAGVILQLFYPILFSIFEKPTFYV
jgi:hypothetical protein